MVAKKRVQDEEKILKILKMLKMLKILKILEYLLWRKHMQTTASIEYIT